MGSTYFTSVVQVFKSVPVLIYFYAINSLGTVLVCHLESHVKSGSCSGPIREAVEQFLSLFPMGSGPVGVNPAALWSCLSALRERAPSLPQS